MLPHCHKRLLIAIVGITGRLLNEIKLAAKSQMARFAIKRPVTHSRSKPDRTGEERTNSYAHRGGAIVMTLAVGVACGFLLVLFFGEWLPPDSPAIIATRGSIEEIRLPVSARTLEDITKFMINGGGGDDFGRIYFNNYLISSSEVPQNLFFTDRVSGKQTRETVIAYAATRNNPTPTDKDVTVFLKHGDNYIVQELE